MNTFNLDTLLDKALDSLDGSSLVDRAKAAASELLTEEFKPQASAATPAADLSQLEDVIGFWRLFDLQACLQGLCLLLPIQPGCAASAAIMQLLERLHLDAAEEEG